MDHSDTLHSFGSSHPIGSSSVGRRVSHLSPGLGLGLVEAFLKELYTGDKTSYTTIYNGAM